MGCQGTPGTFDTFAATHREQRLTGLAVFILMGVSVFMAPVLKVGSLAGVASFPRQGWPYPARLEVPHPDPLMQHRQGGAVPCVGMDCTKGLSPAPQEGWHTKHCSPMSPVHPPHVTCPSSPCVSGSLCSPNTPHHHLSTLTRG